MRAAIARRVAKMEARLNPPVRVRPVVEIEQHETPADALARFFAANPRYRGQPLGVPAPLRTAEDRAAFLADMKASQQALRADARRDSEERQTKLTGQIEVSTPSFWRADGVGVAPPRFPSQIPWRKN